MKATEQQYWVDNNITKFDEIIVEGKFKNNKIGYLHQHCQETYSIDLFKLRKQIETKEDMMAFLKPIIFKNDRFIDRTAKAIFRLPWISTKVIELSNCETENIYEALYWLFNNLTDYPKYCKECNAPITKFISYNKNYLADYCCLKCSNNNKEVWQKKKKSNNEKYGSDFVLSSEIVKDKIKKTMMNKYGVTHNTHIEEVFNKQQESAFKKEQFKLPSGQLISLMGYEPFALSHLLSQRFKETDFSFDKKPTIKYMLDDKECIYYPDFFIPSHNLIIEIKSIWTYFIDLRKNLEKEKYSKLNNFSFEFIIWDKKLNRPLTSNEIEEQIKYLKKTRCAKCFKTLKGKQKKFCSVKCSATLKETQLRRIETNNGEKFKRSIFDFLESQNVIFEKTDFGFYHPISNLLVMLSTNKSQTAIGDETRRTFLIDTLISIEDNKTHLNIFEHDWMNNKTCWEGILKSKLGILPKIPARKTEIRKIGANVTRQFLKQHHAQGFCRAKIHFGLYFKDELVAVMLFDTPRFKSEATWELIRFSAKYTVVGGFSKLLKHFRQTHNGSIVSYADRTRSIGNVYEKTGFRLIRTTPPSPYYVKREKVLTRFNVFERNLKNVLDNVDEAKTVKENLKLNGYKQIWNMGNLVYLLE